MSLKIPGRLWEFVGTDIWTIYNRHYLCIVGYNKFPVIKQMELFSRVNFMQACKIIFSEYGLLSKIVLDMGTNFISENLKTSAGNSAYLMQYCHHTAITTVDKSMYIICQVNCEKMP